jgi:hypothetical protein
MKIRYHSAYFPRIFHPNCAPGWQILEFSEYDFVLAAITVGRANRWDVIQHGPYSYYEMIYRTALIIANIEERPDGYLLKSPAYKALDPTEKSAVSYFLGLTITKLFCDKLLEIPFLMHLEIYGRQIGHIYGPINYRRGKSRPDLIAISHELNPHIFECKGRSGNFNQDSFTKAKNQARMVLSVDNVRSVINVGGMVYFNNDLLEFRWADPLPEENAYEYNFLKVEQLVLDYYRPYVNLIYNSPLSFLRLNDKGPQQIPYLDMKIDLPENIVDLFIENEPEVTKEKLKTVLKDLPKAHSTQIDDGNYSIIGQDGIHFIFGKSWKGRFKKNTEL